MQDSGEKSILDLEDYPSPSVSFIGQYLPGSVVELTEADPNVQYKDFEKQRARKCSRYLVDPYTDPMPKKTKKSHHILEDVDSVEFNAFLKRDDPVW